SFSSLDDLRSFSLLPVLAVIPKVVTAREEIRKKKRRKMAVVSSLAALIGFLVVVHLFFFKFDIFLIKLFRAAQKLPIS
ncbi:MAG: hypothetical protein R3231_11385, partial [bacterium]|nr:hypothetical protein [bacterium]